METLGGSYCTTRNADTSDGIVFSVQLFFLLQQEVLANAECSSPQVLALINMEQDMCFLEIFSTISKKFLVIVTEASVRLSTAIEILSKTEGGKNGEKKDFPPLSICSSYFIEMEYWEN